MVASALKLRRTSGRALYALVQLASIKLCGVVALFNCQLLSEVTQPSESRLNRCDNLSLQLIELGYLCLSPVRQVYPFPNDNDAPFLKMNEETAVRQPTMVHQTVNHEP